MAMKKILISLIAMIVSMALLSSFNKSINDYRANELGGYLIYRGIKSENSDAQWAGEIIAGGGGTALGTAAAGAMEIIVVSNPVGWVIGGVACVL